jgi:hypothetical protein
LRTTIENTPNRVEGYVYSSYGDITYLKQVVASVVTLRRYDQHRPVAIYCSPQHMDYLAEYGLEGHFHNVFSLDVKHQSITGFKHNLEQFLPYDNNLVLDSDIIWCRNPDRLWASMRMYDFTITGNQVADTFFGAAKDPSIIFDVIFRRRERTLKRFGLTQLSRIQSGMIYSADRKLTENVCSLARNLASKREQTHFKSRKREKGRNHESCEWSLSMAMSKLKLQVCPWLNGYESPQLDFLDHCTDHDDHFEHVQCKLYSDRFVYDFKATRPAWLRKLLTNLFSMIPGKGDYMIVTPYCLHFGWQHQKQVYIDFAEMVWSQEVKKNRVQPVEREV